MKSRMTLKSAVAWLLALLMLLQAMPIGTAEGWSASSDVLQAPDYYAVRFLIDGEEQETMFVTIGAAIESLPTAPRRTDYVFAGWYDGDTRITDGFVPQGDTDVRARYNLSHPVTRLSGNTSLGLVTLISEDAKLPGGKKPTAAWHQDETILQRLSVRTRASRVLAQADLGVTSPFWQQEGDISVSISFSWPLFLKLGEQPVLVDDRGQRIEAQFSVLMGQLVSVRFTASSIEGLSILGIYEDHTVDHTVLFLADDAVIESRTVPDGEAIGTFPAAPEKEGCLFAGWVCESVDNVNEETPVTEDLCLIATYELNEQDEPVYPAATADDEAGGVRAHVDVPEGALPVDAQFRMFAVDGDSIRDAVQAAVGTEVSRIVAVDMAFEDQQGQEIQPRLPVTVHLTVQGFQNGETVSVVHIADNGQADVVYSGAPETEQLRDGEEIATLTFRAESFSVYAITWDTWYNTYRLETQLVDTEGNQIGENQTENISSATSVSVLAPAINGYSFVKAVVGSNVNGTQIQRIRWDSWQWQYNTSASGGSWRSIGSNTVYFVYQSIGPSITVNVTSTGGGTTPSQAAFTVSSTDGSFSRSFTYGDMTNGSLTLTESDGIEIGKTYTITETNAALHGKEPTVTYGQNVTLTNNNMTGTLTVANAYPEMVKVYVYVAAYDQEGNQFKNNPEFLELLGISGDTVDGNGYFPVGEIYLDKSFFNGKTTNKWTALINSASDWQKVLAALGDLDTSTLVYDNYGGRNTNFALNQGNAVGGYMSQAIGDVNMGAGSQCTALFGWSGHSYGFADQTVEYHLDLRFQTNKVTFITGNNGITSGASKDGTTVDVRAYITGSAIQQPRNLVIPAGYRLVGYYNDPDFTTPWNKIGTPITQDEVAYIKITPQDNVILYYKPVTPAGGSVSVDAEGLNPETGVPQGSVATANPGYTFTGWYADEACTQMLSTNAAFVPTKQGSQRWIDGTTYYAKFEENTVTLKFVAGEGIDRVELVSGTALSITGDGTGEMTAVVAAESGEPLVVRGIAQDGWIVKEWVIDSKQLTTSDTLTTAKEDDDNATTLWTNRTYVVNGETSKKVKVYKQVEIVGTVYPEDVNLAVYFALKSKETGEFLTRDGSLWTESIQVVNGVPQADYVTFDGLASGTYDVWEVGDANGAKLEPGFTVIERDSQNKKVVVATIRTVHGGSTSNNVMVNDQQREDSLTVINTYSHENETMDFVAKKQWYTERNSYNQEDKANVNIPHGAWSELTVYENGSATPIRTIRLDGTPDEEGEKHAWVATFDGLPVVDSTGNFITYIVKETAYSETIGSMHFYAVKDSINASGGSIKNAVVYGNINVFKQIEAQPRNNEMDELVRSSIGNLKIHLTGPYGYDREFTFSNVSDPYNLSLQITELPAGEYTLEEVNYEDLLTGRKWNPTLSWIKADNGGEQQGETRIVFGVGTNGSSNDTVNVRMKNDYTKYDVVATKVWEDNGIQGLDHPPVSFTLYRIESNGNRSTVGTKIVPANATGEALTVKWEQQDQQDQQYTYAIEEAPVRGYTLKSITGDLFSGFVVTNEYSPAADVTLTKQVTGNGGDVTKVFSFTVVRSDGEPVMAVNADGEPVDQIQLKSGEYVILKDLPIDAVVTVMETGAEKYTASATLTGQTEALTVTGNPTTGEEDNGQRAFTFTVPQPAESGDVTVTVTNDRVIPVPQTGLRLEWAAPLAMMCLALALSAAFLADRRRERAERR